MKLLKPQWVNHDDRALFCVDIHPDGSRFATGGQGQDRTGTISIWNMAPVISENSELDSNTPRQLCQLDNHLGCVNCLRWARSGRFLASGSDDKLVMIWQHAAKSAAGGASALFGSGKPCVEGWRCSATLRGHNGDIFDLAWSPHDVYLATCSVDNLVIIWSAARWGEIIARLEGHSGLVKGVAWDPIGKYVCSQSDDKSLRVWRVSDWRQEVSVEKPFQQTAGTTAVLRCDWSPDGRYVVSAHAVNNGGPTAAIVDRGSWRSEKDFVGHRKAVTCTRFSSAILTLSPTSAAAESTRRPRLHCACAVGSRDRGVSVWLTCLKRPLVVIHDLFEDSVMDLSWHAAKRWLVACSKDGSVAFISFSESELGSSVSEADRVSLHEKLYGRSATLSKDDSRLHGTHQLIESAQLLQARSLASQAAADAAKQQSEETSDAANVTAPVSQSAAVATRKLPAAKSLQTESRTAEGKRRITPMFIPNQNGECDDGPTPFAFGSCNDDDQNTQQDGSDVATNTVLDVNTGATPDDPGTEVSASPAETATVVNKNVTAEIIDKNICPQVSARIEPPSAAVSTNQLVEPSSPVSALVNAAASTIQVKRKASISQRDPSRPTAKRGRPPLNRRPSTPPPISLPPNNSAPPAPSSSLAPPPANPSTSVLAAPASSATVLTTGISTSVLPVPSELQYRHLVAAPALQTRLTLTGIDGAGVGNSTGLPWKVEVNNVPVDGMYQVTCSENGQTRWRTVLSSAVVTCRVSCGRVLLACSDHTLRALSLPAGRLVLPPISVGGQVARLSTRQHHVMVVTCDGRVSTWDLSVPRAVVSAAGAAHLLLGTSASGRDGQPVRLSGCSLSAAGLPVLITADGRAHLYSIDMACWMVISDGAGPGAQFSDVQPSLPTTSSTSSGTSGTSSLPLSTICTQTRRTLPKHRLNSFGRTSNNSSNKSSVLIPDAIVSYLDAQVSAAMFLQSGVEYRLWMCALVRQLALNGDSLRLREICQQLLGPAHSTAALSCDWPAAVIGVDKRALLRQLLPLLASNLSLQRLFTEIKEQLDCSDLAETV